MFAALALATPVSAVEEIALEIGRIDGRGWSSGDVELRLGFASDDRLSMTLTAGSLALPEPFDTLGAVSLDCPLAVATETGLECARAEMRIDGEGGSVASLPLSMRLDRRVDRWRLEVKAARLAPGPLWAFVADQGLVPTLEISEGELSLALEFGADATGPSLLVDAMVSGIDFSDADGLHAGEDLGAHLTWRLSRIGRDWRTSAELRLDAGQIYLDPVFVDARVAPLSADAAGRIDPESGRLHLSPVRVQHDNVASVEGEIGIAADGKLEALDVRVSRSPLAPLYLTYLQPFAIGTLFD